MDAVYPLFKRPIVTPVGQVCVEGTPDNVCGTKGVKCQLLAQGDTCVATGNRSGLLGLGDAPETAVSDNSMDDSGCSMESLNYMYRPRPRTEEQLQAADAKEYEVGLQGCQVLGRKGRQDIVERCVQDGLERCKVSCADGCCQEHPQLQGRFACVRDSASAYTGRPPACKDRLCIVNVGGRCQDCAANGYECTTHNMLGSSGERCEPFQDYTYD